MQTPAIELPKNIHEIPYAMKEDELQEALDHYVSQSLYADFGLHQGRIDKPPGWYHQMAERTALCMLKKQPREILFARMYYSLLREDKWMTKSAICRSVGRSRNSATSKLIDEMFEAGLVLKQTILTNHHPVTIYRAIKFEDDGGQSW